MKISLIMSVRLAAGLILSLLVGGHPLLAGVVTYSYDSLNRLTNVNYGNGAAMSFSYDAAGNRLTYSGAVTNDTIEPTITITSPTSGPAFTTTNATVDLSGTASDNTGVSLVTWENDGTGLIGTASGTTSWSISGVELVPGVNYIWLTGYDLAGNEGYAVLTVTYSLPVGPAIQSSFSSGNLNLSWPSSAGDFVLQTATNLAPPVAWSNVVATVTTNGGALSVSLPATNAQRFFRLRK